MPLGEPSGIGSVSKFPPGDYMARLRTTALEKVILKALEMFLLLLNGASNL